MHAPHYLLAFLLPGILCLVACQSPATPPGAPPPAATEDVPEQDLDERTIVLETLQTMKQDALRNAFAALPRYRYTRYTRTAQGNATHPRTAFIEQVTRINRDAGTTALTVLQADSAGALGGLGSPKTYEQAATALPAYVLLDDPPYLAPRNHEAFVYRRLPDTLYWGASTQVVEIRARPGEGDAQAIRRARFYLDRNTNELVATSIERAENTLFFSEKSRLYLGLRPVSEGVWMPFNVQFQTRLHLPLRATQHVRTTATYYLYERVNTPG